MISIIDEALDRHFALYGQNDGPPMDCPWLTLEDEETSYTKEACGCVIVLIFLHCFK